MLIRWYCYSETSLMFHISRPEPNGKCYKIYSINLRKIEETKNNKRQ